MTSLKRTSQGGGDESVVAASSPLHNPVQITKSAKKRLADPLSSVQRAPAPRRRPATKAPRPRRPIGLKPSELSRRASPGWAVLQFGARCEVRGRLLGRSCTTRCALAVQVAGEACFLLACVIKARWGRRCPFWPGFLPQSGPARSTSTVQEAALSAWLDAGTERTRREEQRREGASVGDPGPEDLVCNVAHAHWPDMRARPADNIGSPPAPVRKRCRSRGRAFADRSSVTGGTALEPPNVCNGRGSARVGGASGADNGPTYLSTRLRAKSVTGGGRSR